MNIMILCYAGIYINGVGLPQILPHCVPPVVENISG
jgi:hypothetical protein